MGAHELFLRDEQEFESDLERVARVLRAAAVRLTRDEYDRLVETARRHGLAPAPDLGSS